MATRSSALEYLTTTKIGEKGQLTVPKEFRDELGLGDGAPFAVLRLGNGLILFPEQRRFEILCERVNDALTGAGITGPEIMAGLPDARSRVYQRRYGKTKSGGRRHGQSRTHRAT